MIIPLAIVDLPLEEGEVTFIVILVAATIAVTAYIRKQQAELRRQKRQLDEQAEFNRKLNSTVDRILSIDQEGGIDGKRRKR